MSPRSEGGGSWFVVIGVSIIQLSILPVVQCFGLIYEQEFQTLGMSTVAITLLIHINNGVASLCGLLSAPVLRQYSFCKVTLVGCVFCCLSICLMSMVNSWIEFILAYSLLFGMGQGILYPSTSLAINSHFKQRRSLAVGLSVAATSFGAVFSPYLVTALLFLYGTAGTVLVLGGVSLHALFGALLLRPPPPPPPPPLPLPYPARGDAGAVEEDEKLSVIQKSSSGVQDPQECKELLENERGTEKSIEVVVDYQNCKGKSQGEGHTRLLNTICARLVTILDLDLLRDPVYINIAMGMGISIASEYNFQMLLPFILVDMADLDKQTLATVMSVQAGADIAARVVSPLLANWLRWNSRCAYVVSLSGSILGRTVLAHFCSDYKIIFLQAIIVGTFKGVKAIFQSLVLPDYVPLEKLPAAHGLYMILNGILSMICGPLIGFVRDQSESYVAALHVTSFLSLLCVFSWIAEYLYKRSKKPKNTNIQENNF